MALPNVPHRFDMNVKHGMQQNISCYQSSSLTSSNPVIRGTVLNNNNSSTDYVVPIQTSVPHVPETFTSVTTTDATLSYGKVITDIISTPVSHLEKEVVTTILESSAFTSNSIDIYPSLDVATITTSSESKSPNSALHTKDMQTISNDSICSENSYSFPLPLQSESIVTIAVNDCSAGVSNNSLHTSQETKTISKQMSPTIICTSDKSSILYETLPSLPSPSSKYDDLKNVPIESIVNTKPLPLYGNISHRSIARSPLSTDGSSSSVSHVQNMSPCSVYTPTIPTPVGTNVQNQTTSGFLKSNHETDKSIVHVKFPLATAESVCAMKNYYDTTKCPNLASGDVLSSTDITSCKIHDTPSVKSALDVHDIPLPPGDPITKFPTYVQGECTRVPNDSPAIISYPQYELPEAETYTSHSLLTSSVLLSTPTSDKYASSIQENGMLMPSRSSMGLKIFENINSSLGSTYTMDGNSSSPPTRIKQNEDAYCEKESYETSDSRNIILDDIPLPCSTTFSKSTSYSPIPLESDAQQLSTMSNAVQLSNTMADNSGGQSRGDSIYIATNIQPVTSISSSSVTESCSHITDTKIPTNTRIKLHKHNNIIESFTNVPDITYDNKDKVDNNKGETRSSDGTHVVIEMESKSLNSEGNRMTFDAGIEHDVIINSVDKSASMEYNQTEHDTSYSEAGFNRDQCTIENKINHCDLTENIPKHTTVDNSNTSNIKLSEDLQERKNNTVGINSIDHRMVESHNKQYRSNIEIKNVVNVEGSRRSSDEQRNNNIVLKHDMPTSVHTSLDDTHNISKHSKSMINQRDGDSFPDHKMNKLSEKGTVRRISIEEYVSKKRGSEQRKLSNDGISFEVSSNLSDANERKSPCSDGKEILSNHDLTSHQSHDNNSPPRSMHTHETYPEMYANPVENTENPLGTCHAIFVFLFN